MTTTRTASEEIDGHISEIEELLPLGDEEFWSLRQHGNLTTTTMERFPSENTWLVSSDKELSESNNQGIPKIIHKTYYQNTGGFQDPEQFTDSQMKALRSWTEKNPAYRMQFFDLTRSRAYLAKHFHPIFLRAFDCIESFAGKSDFFRIAVVYREGGWYSDWKEVCLHDGLLDSLAGNHSLFLVWDMGHSGVIKEKCIVNGFLGSVPRHPLFVEVLKFILQHVQSLHYGSSPIHNTGPCVLGQAYRNIRNRTFVEDVNFGEFGKPEPLQFFYKGEKIIRHKCEGCGEGQDWATGNNYNTLHKRKTFYCQDAPSLFLPDERDFLR